MKIFTYFNTIKYLKLTQIYYRLRRRVIKPTPRKIRTTLSDKKGVWITHYLYQRKFFENNRCNFLNVDGVINTTSNWNDEKHSKLWLYNLHYFDDLNAANANQRTQQHLILINRWIEENPAATGNGWEPYPTSLRIVNWIKAFLSGLPLSNNILNSLSQQADYLSQDLERHILGNHLFANAKALVFAGLFLSGRDADKWLELGLKILKKELGEQILLDGGNFELSPMYHAIMLADLLDLINVFASFPEKSTSSLVERLKALAKDMLHWLKVMTHVDGEVGFFNDSAIGIAANLENLCVYSHKLSIKCNPIVEPGLITLADSGYSRISMPLHYLLIDHAKIGPDYLPGHAHADSLSFEWAVDQQRVLVNSGTSIYGLGVDRHEQRKTRSHNTVEVAELDSSEVWSGFRVARRANINLIKTQVTKNLVVLEAEHDGYKRLKIPVTHQRKFSVKTDVLEITDSLVGKNVSAIAYFHLYPGIRIWQKNVSEFILTLEDNTEIYFSSDSNSIEVCDSNWHPEFGKNVPNIKLAVKFNTNRLKSTFSIRKN